MIKGLGKLSWRCHQRSDGVPRLPTPYSISAVPLLMWLSRRLTSVKYLRRDEGRVVKNIGSFGRRVLQKSCKAGQYENRIRQRARLI
jgi:hypothetical protein